MQKKISAYSKCRNRIIHWIRELASTLMSETVLDAYVACRSNASGAYHQIRKGCPSKLDIRFRIDNVFWKYQSCVTLFIWISSLKNSLYTIYDQRSLKDRFKIVCTRTSPLQISQTNQRKDVQESAATITRQTARMSICRISTLATLNKKHAMYHVYTNLALKFDVITIHVENVNCWLFSCLLKLVIPYWSRQY